MSDTLTQVEFEVEQDAQPEPKPTLLEVAITAENKRHQETLEKAKLLEDLVDWDKMPTDAQFTITSWCADIYLTKEKFVDFRRALGSNWKRTYANDNSKQHGQITHTYRYRPAGHEDWDWRDPRHDLGISLYMQVVGANCKRVQVGTETREHPVYEYVCE